MASDAPQQKQSMRTGIQPGGPAPAAALYPPEVMQHLAMLSSSHPDPAQRANPRFQTNNPLNWIDTQPSVRIAGNPYLDAAIPVRMPGMVPSEEMSQRIVLNRPNLRGIPELMLPVEMANALAAEAVYSRMPLSGSQQVEMMEAQARQGTDTSPGAAQKRRARGG